MGEVRRDEGRQCTKHRLPALRVHQEGDAAVYSEQLDNAFTPGVIAGQRYTPEGMAGVNK